MSCISSTFITGAPSALRQPFRFQPGIHFTTELMTYWLSQSTSRSSSTPAVARNSSSTAFSSPMLFVPWGHPPAAQRSSSMYQAHPAGPGLPSADPSAAAVIVTDASYGPRRPSLRDEPRRVDDDAGRSALDVGEHPAHPHAGGLVRDGDQRDR